MLVYNGAYALHTAIAYFDVILVKEGVVLVLSWEVFGYQLEECFSYISFHVIAERRIVPDYVSLAVTSRSGCLSVGVV